MVENDLTIGDTNHGCRAQPHGENCQLDGGGDPDEVASARIVCARQAGSHANHGRNCKAAQGTLDSMKANRAALHRGSYRPAAKTQRNRNANRLQTMDSKFSVSTPKTYSGGKDLCEKWQEKSGNHDSDRVIFNDPGGKKNRARKGSSQVAPGEMAELPQILDHIRKRFARRYGHSFNWSGAHDCSNLSGGESKAGVCQGGGIHQCFRYRTRFGSRSFNTEQDALGILPVYKYFACRDFSDSGGSYHPDPFVSRSNGNRKSDLMHKRVE